MLGINDIYSGISRNLRYLFIEEREKHVNSVVVDTNNLIMRLDKLINDTPSDVSRKGLVCIFKIL